MRLIGLLLRGKRTFARILHGKPRNHHQCFLECSATRGFEQHTGKLRVNRQAREHATDVSKFSVFLQRMKFRQNGVTVGNSFGRRRLHEIEVTYVAQLQSLHAQNDGCQIRTHDFRIGVVRASGPIVFVVETNADAVGHASATAGALIGRSLAHGFNQQLLDLVAIAIALDARKSRVNHIPNAGNRNRRFGHVGSQHNAPDAAAFEHSLLFLRRKPRIQRQYFHQSGAITGTKHFGGFTDFALSGQKHQNVAAPGDLQLITSIGHGVHQRLVVGLIGIVHRTPANLHGIGAPRDRKHRCRFAVDFKMLGKAFRINCCRGDDDLEILSLGKHPLKVAQKKINVDGSLVRFVDNDRVVAL